MSMFVTAYSSCLVFPGLDCCKHRSAWEKLLWFGIQRWHVSLILLLLLLIELNQLASRLLL